MTVCEHFPVHYLVSMVTTICALCLADIPDKGSIVCVNSYHQFQSYV